MLSNHNNKKKCGDHCRQHFDMSDENKTKILKTPNKNLSLVSNDVAANAEIAAFENDLEKVIVQSGDMEPLWIKLNTKLHSKFGYGEAISVKVNFAQSTQDALIYSKFLEKLLTTKLKDGFGDLISIWLKKIKLFLLGDNNVADNVGLLSSSSVPQQQKENVIVDELPRIKPVSIELEDELLVANDINICCNCVLSVSCQYSNNGFSPNISDFDVCSMSGCGKQISKNCCELAKKNNISKINQNFDKCRYCLGFVPIESNICLRDVEIPPDLSRNSDVLLTSSGDSDGCINVFTPNIHNDSESSNNVIHTSQNKIILGDNNNNNNNLSSSVPIQSVVSSSLSFIVPQQAVIADTNNATTISRYYYC
jgi:hypothetical protein